MQWRCVCGCHQAGSSSNQIKGNRKCYPNIVHTVGLLLSCKAFQVRSPEDIVRWEASEAYQVANSLSRDWLTEQLSIAHYVFVYNFKQEYLGFVIAIGDAVKGKKLTDEVKVLR